MIHLDDWTSRKGAKLAKKIAALRALRLCARLNLERELTAALTPNA